MIDQISRQAAIGGTTLEESVKALQSVFVDHTRHQAYAAGRKEIMDRLYTKNMHLLIDGGIYPFYAEQVDQIMDEPGVHISGYVRFYDWERPTGQPHKIAVCIPKPVKWIFNGPATIAIWEDGTKTVVKLMPGDTYDPEKAVAMCYIKKMLGTSEAMKARKKAMKAYEEQKEPEHDMDPEEKKILEKLTRMAEEIKRREQNIENRSV